MRVKCASRKMRGNKTQTQRGNDLQQQRKPNSRTINATRIDLPNHAQRNTATQRNAK